MRWWTRAVFLAVLFAAATAGQKQRKNVKSAERTIFLLVALSTRASTFTELLYGLNYPKASLHGLLYTLQQLGYVHRGEDHRYRLVKALHPTGEP